jgi:hypothetical protein
MSDIRVVGLVAGNHMIEDIARDVPYGTTVVIPGELALMSKDLWRSISQKFLYQLPSIPLTTPTSVTDSDRKRLESYISELEAHVLRLELENKGLREAQQIAIDSKLDAILSAVGSIKTVAQPSHFVTHAQTSAYKDDFVDGSAPTFLPSEIKPTDVEDSRIDVQRESSTSGVSEAAQRLRKIRKGR